MSNHKLIDNSRVTMANVLKKMAPTYKHLSIATGYWDLPGTMAILDSIRDYESIRLLIGHEPHSSRFQSKYHLDPSDPANLFPDADIMHDLVKAGKIGGSQSASTDELRSAATSISEMLQEGKLQVRVFRHPRLHAKAYIFGTHETPSAIGIVGSSNFTYAGLTSNAELNSVEDESKIVQFQPVTLDQEHGHLSWFESLWNDPEAIEWTGDFTKLVQDSPMGDLTFGPYDVYIKTLMEVFPDELIPPQQLSESTEDVLFRFQDRNAGILLNKLNKMGVAMLSDSVGLGKTITAGAVIKHYRDNGFKRIIVIAPAALRQQWKDDLGSFFDLAEGFDFKTVSMQDQNDIQELIDDSSKPWMRAIDLVVIDEAHNLRAAGSTRYQMILELLQANEAARVLMLTATPINNSLIDIANQIQLGSKGSLISIDVPYITNEGNLRRIDFFDALKNIQAEVRKAEKDGTLYNWERNKGALASGLRHYLVRSTRQGVEAEGGIVLKDGTKSTFPKSRVEQIEYSYSESSIKMVLDAIESAIDTVFEGIDPCTINLDVAANLTQQSSHPLDFYKESLDNLDYLATHFVLSDNSSETLELPARIESVIPNVFQIINLLGLTPYRPEIYNYRYYKKSVGQIRELGLKGEEQRRLQIQLAIHNIIHVTWLKRLESSVASLLKSVEYYLKRLELFTKYLDKGYIVTLADANTLETEYGEDIDQAFVDYEDYLHEVQAMLDAGESASEIRKRGVERKEADEKAYNLEAMRRDIARDRAIAHILIEILANLSTPSANGKLQAFANYLETSISNGGYGKKALVFSFFSDTIDYLKDSLPQIIGSIPDFSKRVEFITGNSGKGAEHVARRFAPAAKKYSIKPNEQEIDYLFATDVLSEGQNLQDAGILINYDLHWNPVRMIQRNGRINRLGSQYPEVLIANTRPHSDLELYLRLVRRLERKIDTIKNSIGTDQSVLGEVENPIEFIDYFSSDTEKASAAAEAAAYAGSEIDILQYSDEYIFELRRYISEHEDDGEIERISKIPLGKWNYLPKKQKYGDAELSPDVDAAFPDQDCCLALERVTGKTSQTGVPVSQTLFVSIETVGRYLATPIEDEEALALIKTVPTDNQRLHDKISIERDTVARRAMAQAKAKAQTANAQFDIKPQQLETLTFMQQFLPPGFDLQGVVKNGISDYRQKRGFEKIIKDIVRERKTHGSPFASTISRFEQLINQLQNTQGESTEVESAEGVLFYYSQN
jgi:ERCC4-related helicase